MDDSDREAFAGMITAVAEAFNRKTSDPMLDGYWLGLEDMPIEGVAFAVKQAMRSCKFMPSPAELRELSGELKPEMRAALAWTVAQNAVGSVGCYASIQFDDPILNATIRRMGGWEMFCAIKEAVIGFKQRDFQQLYVAIWHAGMSEHDTKPMLGILARDKEPHDRPEPVLIGCQLPAIPSYIVRPALGSAIPQVAGLIDVVKAAPVDETDAKRKAALKQLTSKV